MDDIKQPFRRIKLIITVLDRGLGDEVVELCRENGVTFNMVSPGYSAAGLDIMDYLGLTDSEMDIVFSITTEDRTPSILNKIHYKFDLDEPEHGFALAIPISGVSGPLALRYISGIPDLV